MQGPLLRGAAGPDPRCACAGTSRVVGDAQDRPAAVVRDVHGAVRTDGDADGTRPGVGAADRRAAGSVGRPVVAARLSREEAGDEVLDGAWRAAGHRDADDLVALRLGAVPGAVQRDEQIAAVLGRELLAGIESQAERG